MNELIFITQASFLFLLYSIHMQIGFIKQILKRLADIQFLTWRRSETSFPNIFNQNFKKIIMDFENSKIFPNLTHPIVQCLIVYYTLNIAAINRLG